MTYKRIIQDNDIVKITTVKKEVFIGKILKNFFIIKENNTLDVEIFLSQTPEHTGPYYGTIGLPISFITSIHKL